MRTSEECLVYEQICRHDGIKAREIAKNTGLDRTEVNRLLYSAPFMKELCYRDDSFLWRGLIRQAYPHRGLGDFCGYYSKVDQFLSLSEQEWMDSLMEGCRNIGRNLNDTRGLFHSFRDCRETMLQLFQDMEGVDYGGWEIAFEVRINRGKYIRIYTDVLVITEDKAFSLEFKMKDKIEQEEVQQAAKYTEFLEVIFGRSYDVIPALVLTRASDLYRYQQLEGSTAEIPVCSGDMLFNLFNEYLGFFPD